MKHLIPPSLLYSSSNPMIEQYEQIRSKYQAATSDSGMIQGNQARIVGNGPNGLIRNSTDYSVLQTRIAGFDKLFTTLIQGIVDDPDYALRKDPQIYQRMLRDPQIYYCLLVRKTATSSLPWQVTAPDDYANDTGALQLAERSNARIRRIPQFRELLNNILDALLPGLSVNELIWKVNDQSEYVVGNHFPVFKDRFKYDKFGRLRLLQPKAPTFGVPVPDYKFISHNFQVKDGAWMRPMDAGYVFYGQGLADTPLYHYFYFKVTALRFMLKNLERNASPFKIYYSGPQNAQLASKMDQIMSALQNDSVVGIPGKKGDTNVDVESAKGGAELYTGLIEYVDRLITRAILGQELMTEMPAVGSYAAAQVHSTVFARIAEHDKDLLQDTLNNTLMHYDAMLNTPDIPEWMRPVFRFKSTAVLDGANFLQSAKLAMDLGLSLSEPQIRELSGFREPQPHEKVLDAQSMMELQAQQQAMMGQDPESQMKMESEKAKATQQGRNEGSAITNKKNKSAAKATKGSKK